MHSGAWTCDGGASLALSDAAVTDGEDDERFLRK